MIIRKDDFQRKENIDPVADNIQHLLRTAANNILKDDSYRNVLNVLAGTTDLINQLLEPFVDNKNIN